ncbi:MAG: methyltransferase domain-containing protein [Gemmatimonadota bacterium]|nr:MAG: methyltransferase domain-containing protein [Gemmatimonadota bacterium]
MAYSDPREPHARALCDFFGGETDAKIVVHNSLGEREELQVAVFFRAPEDFFSFERAALELCRGRVLDVGAGTGVHSLYLQEQGLEVCAIDVLREAVEIMRLGGVRDARLADIAEFREEPFDTILMMMNGIGILGTLDGLDRFLRDVPRLLKSGGQIILDSGPARVVGESGDAAVEVALGGQSTYHGEAWITLEYKGEKGPPFRELYADSETLTRHAAGAGFECEIIFRDELGGYLAQLTRAGGLST